MIKLDNQLVLQFNIGEYQDFIQTQDFHRMEIIENAGGPRPILNLTFIIRQEKILQYLNQGNLITLRYGIKELTSDALQFEIQGDNSNKQYSLGASVSILAAFYNPIFTNVAQYRCISGKSFEALKEIADKTSMKLKTNVTRSNDKQTWDPAGRTNWKFIRHIWERSYKDKDTFFAYGFDNDNIYFYNVRDKFNAGPDWILTPASLGSGINSKIVNIGTYLCDDSQVGPINEMIGRNKKTVGYNIDTGDFFYPESSLKSFSTLHTNSVNLNSLNCENYNYMITSSKDHSKALEAINQNYRNNLLYSAYTVYVPVPGQYRDFHLLDCVQLLPVDPNNSAEGLYLITGITRQYSKGLYQTNLVLNRESANGIRGALESGNE